MSRWKHLFVDGEFSARVRLLSDLTLEHVTTRPTGASHSIYEELWHLTKWQSIVVRRDAAAAAEWVAGSQQFPAVPPESEVVWQELVAEFLGGADKAVEWGGLPDSLDEEARPGVTLAEALQSLAVHSAYHFGKIVALRQQIGAWPPSTNSAPPILTAVRDWAEDRSDIRAVALVGSHARGDARPDSDVDLVLLCIDPALYLDQTAWVSSFGEVDRSSLEDWGRVRSVRVHYRCGPEVEFAIADLDWAEVPPDRGTSDVLRSGCLILLDRDGNLARVLRASDVSA